MADTLSTSGGTFDFRGITPPPYLGAYAPDPEAMPPVEYHRLGEPALPVVAWQPRHRRPSRAMQLTRATILVFVGAFALSQILGALS